MRPQRHASVRQPTRKLQQVPAVRPQVEVGMPSGKRPIGGARRAALLSVMCAASILGQYGPDVTSRSSAEAQSDLINDGNGYRSLLDTIFGDSGSTTDINTADAFFGDTIHGNDAEPNDVNEAEPAHGVRHDAGRRPGEHVRLGVRRRVVGNIDQAVRAYESESKVYTNLATASSRPPPMADLLELYAGQAKPTKFAAEFGLRALQPVDLIYGVNLDDPRDQSRVLKAVRTFKPWLLVVGFPCTKYSLINQNCNYAHRLRELEVMREEDAPMRKFICDLLLEQHASGRFFILENPLTSRLWQQAEVVEVINTPGVCSSTCHSGAYAAETADGRPIKKSLRFLGNEPEMMVQLGRTLSSRDLLYCKPLQGADTTASQVYPDALAYEIVKSLHQVLRQRDPQRFGYFETYVVARPVSSPEEWKPVFDQVKRSFGETSSKRPFNIEPDGQLGRSIADLLRMNPVKIQATHLPVQRRLPMDVAFSACGAALLHNDNSIVVETEALDNIQFPKQRFDKPVVIGIFVYGDLRNEPQPEREQLGELPPSSFPTDIKFDGLGPHVTLDVKRTVARRRLNLGHPSPQELIRLMCYHGSPSQRMIDAVRKLRCSTCERLKMPQQPRPSALPSLQPRQFCDEIQSDVVFVRTTSGMAIPILGMVDVATNLHQAGCLPEKSSESAFKLFEKLWLRPYGLPVKIRCDPDPLFQGHCKDGLEALGIEVEFCPAEAHWTIATIERRNAVLRTVLEKMIDTNAATDVDSVEGLLSPTLHALNSISMTKGRSAYQAVFGRVPRVPGCDILADPVALASSPGDAAVRSEQIRAEALRRIAEFAVDRGIRRALLRKTRATGIADISPGEPCAFWRWRRKGPHKRGGWAMARFLAWDPSHVGSQAWLRTGTTTVLVTAEQLRVASGFERWQPSSEDIAALKDGSQSLRDSIWADETGPPAPGEVADLDNNLLDLDDEMAIASLPPTPGMIPPSPQPSVLPQLPATSVNIRVDSPRYQQQNQQVVVQRFGDPTRGRSRSRNPPTPRRTGTRSPALPHQPRLRPLPQAPQPPVPSTPHAPQAVFGASQSDVPEGLESAQYDSAAFDSAPMETPDYVEPFESYPDVQPTEVSQEAAQPSGDTLELPGQAEPQRQPAEASQEATQPSGDTLQGLPEQPALPQAPPQRRVRPDELDHVEGGNNSFYQSYLNSGVRKSDVEATGKEAADYDTSDTDADDPVPPIKTERSLTRKELKQLDREVPWRQLLHLPKEKLQAFVDSAVKEARSLLHWESIEPLSASEIAKVMSSPQLRRRILKSRAVYRGTARGQGPLRAKCRVVCLGHQDPDLRSLTRESPTPTRMAEHVVFAMMVAGLNKELLGTSHTWTSWLADASTAFLQGQQPEGERPLPLYMLPPRDGIIARTSEWAAGLYRIRSNVYGLSNAPRLWTAEVIKRLKSLGYEQHCFDRMLFIKRDSNHEVVSYILVYVDDFIGSFRDDYNVQEVKDAFTWGSFEFMEPGKTYTFKGKQLTFTPLPKGRFELKIEQSDFIDTLESSSLPRGRLTKDKKLSDRAC